LGIALAPIEEALDRLSVSMLQAAHAVTVAQGAAHESCVEPAAEALCFHLRLTAERLREPQLGCESSRSWTRRLLASDASSDRYVPIVDRPPDVMDTRVHAPFRPAGSRAMS